MSEGNQVVLEAFFFPKNAAPLVHSSPATPKLKRNASMYSQQTWDRLKTQLHDLYITQQRPLESVKEVMLWRYRFRPSARMYKQKFKEWGWAKNGLFSRPAKNNCKAPQRGRSGHNYVSHRIDIPMWTRFSSMPEQFDKMNLAIHCYIDGQFCSPSRRWERRTFDIASSDGMTGRSGAWHGIYEQCNNAFILIGWNAPDIAFSQLRKMCEDATTILSHDDPTALVYLWPICGDIARLRYMMPTSEMDILRLALNYWKCRVGELFGCRHPVFLLLESLCAISHTEIEEALKTGYETSIRAFETVLGTEHPIVLHMWTRYFRYYGRGRLDRTSFWNYYQRIHSLATSEKIPQDIKIGVLYQYASALIHIGDAGEYRGKGQPSKIQGIHSKHPWLRDADKCQRCYDNIQRCTWGWGSGRRGTFEKCDGCQIGTNINCIPLQLPSSGSLPPPFQFTARLFNVSKELWHLTSEFRSNAETPRWSNEARAVLLSAEVLGRWQRNMRKVDDFDSTISALIRLHDGDFECTSRAAATSWRLMWNSTRKNFERASKQLPTNKSEMEFARNTIIKKLITYGHRVNSI